MQLTMLLRRTCKMFIHYTDFHNVDEDMVTISLYGSNWLHGSKAGISYRDTDESPTISYNTVASLKNKNSLSRY